jgi:hypothetical protein
MSAPPPGLPPGVLTNPADRLQERTRGNSEHPANWLAVLLGDRPEDLPLVRPQG